MPKRPSANSSRQSWTAAKSNFGCLLNVGDWDANREGDILAFSDSCPPTWAGRL